MDVDRNGHCSDSESVASDCSSSDEDKIHVGSEYQANVPNNVLDKSFCYLELDKSDPVWLPSKLNLASIELEQYVQHAQSMYNICEEQSLALLHDCHYDLDRAVKALSQTKRCADTLDKWSHADRENFINAHNYFGKKFKMIQANLPNKSISDLVDYYYTWKKTRRSVSLISQYCKVLALHQSHSLAEESSQVNKSAAVPVQSPASLEIQDSDLNHSSQPSTQTSSQGSPIDNIEPSLLEQDLVLSSGIDISDSCPTSTTPELPRLHSLLPPSSNHTPSNVAADVFNSVDVSSAVNVLKDLIPEHLSYLLECLSPSSPKINEDDAKTDSDEYVKSSQTNPMFARCTVCKHILDTWTFSSTSGILCYSCKPSGEEAVSREEIGSSEMENTGEVKKSDMCALSRLNEVCRQTCDETKQHTCESPLKQTCQLDASDKHTCESQVKQTCQQDASGEHTCRGNKVDGQGLDENKVNEGGGVEMIPRIEVTPTKQRTLKLVPRGLYFNIVDYIEIATNKGEYVDDMFKRMDRDIYNLAKRVRSNNISLDSMLDQASGKDGSLDKYRSSNNNDDGLQVDESKVGVLWNETEILLAIQGFLTYGKDFRAISEILETKTTKQVAHFYQENRAYYDLDVLINEHSSKEKSAMNKNSQEESMEVL